MNTTDPVEFTFTFTLTASVSALNVEQARQILADLFDCDDPVAIDEGSVRLTEVEGSAPLRTTPKRNLWASEFGASYAIPKAVIAHPCLEDKSWHNDVAPKFELGTDDLTMVTWLWVQHVTPEKREDDSCPRFALTTSRDDDGGDVHMHMETEDLDEVLKKMAEMRAFDATEEANLVSNFCRRWEVEERKDWTESRLDTLTEEWEQTCAIMGWPVWSADETLDQLQQGVDPRDEEGGVWGEVMAQQQVASEDPESRLSAYITAADAEYVNDERITVEMLNDYDRADWATMGDVLTGEEWESVEDAILCGQSAAQNALDMLGGEKTEGDREYSYDVTLNASVRVSARSEAQAREMMNEHLECLNGTGRLGVFPETGQAGVIVTEASLATEPSACSLFAIDDSEYRPCGCRIDGGEDPESCGDCDGGEKTEGGGEQQETGQGSNGNGRALWLVSEGDAYPVEFDDCPSCIIRDDGGEPDDTEGVWAWDETELLVGTCRDDLQKSRAAQPGPAQSNQHQNETQTGATAMELINYHTNEVIRKATAEEAEASKEAASYDGGAGVIVLDCGTKAYAI